MILIVVVHIVVTIICIIILLIIRVISIIIVLFLIVIVVIVVSIIIIMFTITIIKFVAIQTSGPLSAPMAPNPASTSCWARAPSTSGKQRSPGPKGAPQPTWIAPSEPLSSRHFQPSGPIWVHLRPIANCDRSHS